MANEDRSYIAFISYRHKPLDKRAAELIQRSIEGYVVPDEYRERVGGRRLGLVFRDEDELPASPSLTRSITDALDRSGFLIVICTPDLPKSEWCKAEIDYFLKTHDRDHVLCVLVDGEPKESFSPLLLHEYDQDGNVTADIEPIAANIAGGDHSIDRRAFRKEIVRIYAALLRCPFDALWHRERRARVVRTMTGMAVMLAVLLVFVAVVLSKNARIKSSLVASYVNSGIQSSETGDYETAMAYYAEALGSDKSNRKAKLGALVELQRSGWIVYSGEDNEGRPYEFRDSREPASESGKGMEVIQNYDDMQFVDRTTGKVISEFFFPWNSLDWEVSGDGERVKILRYSGSDWGDTGKMISLYDTDGTLLAESMKNVRYDITGDNFSTDGEGILWADTRSIRVLSGYDVHYETPTLWVEKHIIKAEFSDDGHIMALHEGGGTSDCRVADFAAKENTGAAAEETDTEATENKSEFRISDDRKRLLLLDEKGNEVDSVAMETLGITIFSSFTDRGDFVDHQNQKSYLFGRDENNIDRLFCIGVTEDQSKLAEPVELDFDKEREILSCAAYPGGFAIAATGNTIFVYRDSEKEPCRIIDTKNTGYIKSLDVSQSGLLAAEIWMDGKLHNETVELWDLEDSQYIASLEDMKEIDLQNLRFSSDGTQLIYDVRYKTEYYKKNTDKGQYTRIWLLSAPDPDKEAVRLLSNITSYELSDDMTLRVRKAQFSGNLGNWSELFDTTYPYEAA